MPAIVPNEGEIRLLTELLDGGTARENWLLKLFQNNITPAETDTAATYTEATFSGYAAKTLTRTISGSTWQVPTSGAPAGGWSLEALVAKSAYGSAPQSWTCGATGNTIYGYFVVGITSGKVILAERFTTPRTLSANAVLSLTPDFEAA